MSKWPFGTLLGLAFATGLGGGLIVAALAADVLPKPAVASVEVRSPAALPDPSDSLLASSPLYPDPRAMPERDIAEPPMIERQLRSAIDGCRIEGSVRGTQLSAVIRC